MARVAFMLDELFEDSEFQVPYDRVRDAGHEPVIVGLETGKEVTGKHGAPVTIERGIDEVGADEFDALVIPGGYSPSPQILEALPLAVAGGWGCRSSTTPAPTTAWTACS
jgi:protease I